MTKYKLMIDLTPAGWAYGFPKAVPAEALGGIGQDIFIRNDFDLEKWVVEQGYPETSFQYFRTWTEEDEQKEYYYPGSDPQE